MSGEYLSIAEKQSHVESIVELYPETAGFQSYEYLRSNVDEQKADFIQNNTSLNLDYSELTIDHVKAIKKPMLEALRTLMAGERDERTESLFSTIEYRYSELFLIDLARQINSGNEVSDEVIAWYRNTNEALYGKPDVNIFNYVAHQNLLMPSLSDSQDSELAGTIKNELRGLLGVIPESDYQPYVPDRETLDRIGVFVHQKFDSLIEHIDPMKTYDVPAMLMAFQHALDKLDGTDFGWRAEVVPNSAAVSTSAHQKKIEVGVNRVDSDGATLRKLVIHEIGVHALRSINALRAGWLSAAYGLNDYLSFEEGLAVALEAAYSGFFKPSGRQYYLIAGLAYGLDGQPPRDLRSVYEIVWREKVLAKLNQGLSDVVIAKAKSVAFTECMRMFRGSTAIPGLIYLKDLAYFKGQELAWKHLSGIYSQGEFDQLFSGKSDCTNKSHQLISAKIAKTLMSS